MADEQVSFDEKDLEELTISFLTKAGTFKDLRGLTDKDMEAIYSVGHSLYNNGKYEEAHEVFKFLSFYDHLEKRWWMGLGATRQMMKNYEEAALAYSYTAMLDVEDPRPHIHAAECLMALERYEDADSALSAAVHWAGEKPEHADLKQRAETMLQALESKGEGGETS